ATERHQHRNELVDIPDREETSQEHDRANYFFRPCQRVAFLSGAGFWNGDRRLAKTEIQGVIGTDADAIHAFHATGIDDHAKLFHLRVNDHIRSAGRGAVAALIARVGNANFSGREFVGETEEPTIRAGVRAKAFRSQEINGHKPTDE